MLLRPLREGLGAAGEWARSSQAGDPVADRSAWDEATLHPAMLPHSGHAGAIQKPELDKAEQRWMRDNGRRPFGRRSDKSRWPFLFFSASASASARLHPFVSAPSTIYRDHAWMLGLLSKYLAVLVLGTR